MLASLHLSQSARQQRGFTLIELSLVLVLMSMAITTFIVLQSQQAADNRARAVALTYERMNKAVGGYLQTYYKELTALRPECGRTNWAANSGNGISATNYTGCNLNLQLNGGPVTPVVNALQPTPKELAQLGFLEGGSAYVDSLPLPTLTSANRTLAFTTGNWLVGGPGAAILPARFMVLIQFMCINGGSVSVFFTTGACASGTIDLRSLVFNSQPFNVQADDPSSQVLYQALDMVGSDGYLSGPGPGTNTPTQDTGELRSVKGAAEPTMSNPTRFYPGNFGTPFIFAMRNGYGTADWSLFKNQLDALQTQVNNLIGTVSNLNNTVNNLNNTINSIQDNGVRWVRNIWSTDDVWFRTSLNCNEWTPPVAYRASLYDGSGFMTNIACPFGFWEVYFRNPGNGTQNTEWMSFKGKEW